jgi:NAD(P)H-hydrate epimerase
MKVLTAEEMRATDTRTLGGGVDSLTLMERAGRWVAELAAEHFSHSERIVVLCGGGNNGGDGLVAARHLEFGGAAVVVMLLSERGRLSADCSSMLKSGVTVECTSAEALQKEHLRLSAADLIVDAITGTGFRAPLRGVAGAAVEMVNALDVPVLAVDLPTGWDADASTADTAMRADAVVTFTAPKPAHVFGVLTRYSSDPVAVVEIGSPA